MGFSGRKRKSTASDSTPSETESLTPFLLKGLAWGVFSASQIQQIAAACLQDFTTRQYEPPATRLHCIYICSSVSSQNNLYIVSMDVVLQFADSFVQFMFKEEDA